MTMQRRHHPNLRGAAVALVLACGAATAEFTTVAGASPGTRGLVSTAWDCSNNDTATFLLPGAAVSPSAGSYVAPFPGILTAVDGPADMTLGTYVLTDATFAGPVPASFGEKVGVVANGTTTCTLEGTNITVTIAPA